MNIENAVEEDIAGWLKLAREVEPLFGPMADVPEFENVILKGIRDGRGFCIRKSNGDLYGAVLISIKQNEIGWLAVTAEERRKGIGEILLKYALSRLDRSMPVFVKTFKDGVKGGEAAVGLYRKLGFKVKEDAGLNPAGIPIVKMVAQFQKVAEQ